MITVNKKIRKYLERNPQWTDVKNIIYGLSDKGFEAVLAGGAVRDALLDKTPDDLDVATSAKPVEILRIFPSGKKRFADYGVILLPLKKGQSVEVTCFRKEFLYRDGRRPSSISYCSMSEDAKRRDFTVNALFYKPQTEELIDFNSGIKDLKKRLLRVIGDPKRKFHEDHLRVLRALRLSHQLDFEIDQKTQKTIPLFAKKIQCLSQERVLEELIKMFSSGRMDLALKNLYKYHLTP